MMKDSCYILRREYLAQWVSALIKQGDVLAPVATGDGKFAFEILEKAEDLRLDYTTTTIPPTQKAFMSVGEKVISWKKVEGRTVFEAGNSQKPLIIFGMHPYDIHALKAWDETIGEKKGDLADPDYVAKRSQTVIIGLDVIVPPPDSFCASLGTHIAEDGYSIMLTDLRDGRYFFEAANGLLLYFAAPYLEEAKKRDFELREQLREKTAKQYPKTLDIPKEGWGAFLEKRILHPFFEATGELCVACAKCTIVCPTCTCCNLREEPALDGQSGCRIRECDSCQLYGFTKMTGGVISRKTPGARVRHRILDKFDYHHGDAPSCVGCGRCVGVCPADIADPVKALDALKEEVSHE